MYIDPDSYNWNNFSDKELLDMLNNIHSMERSISFKLFAECLKRLMLHIKPDSGKPENVYHDLNSILIKNLEDKSGFSPPPWDAKQFPERTLGWLAYQKFMKEDDTIKN